MNEVSQPAQPPQGQPQVPSGQPQYVPPAVQPQYMQRPQTAVQPKVGLTGQLPAPPQAAVYSPYVYQQMGVRPPMSQMAIWAFVSSFFIGILGVVLGILASKQIGNRGLRGVGFAMAGFYIGIFVTIIQLTFGILFGTIFALGAFAAS